MLVTLFGGFRDRLWWKPPWGLGPSKEGVESVQRGQVSKGTRVSEDYRPVTQTQQARASPTPCRSPLHPPNGPCHQHRQ